MEKKCLTVPETNSKSTWKWMVGILSRFLLGVSTRPIFRCEVMLVSGRVKHQFFPICFPRKKSPHRKWWSFPKEPMLKHAKTASQCCEIARSKKGPLTEFPEFPKQTKPLWIHWDLRRRKASIIGWETWKHDRFKNKSNTSFWIRLLYSGDRNAPKDHHELFGGSLLLELFPPSKIILQESYLKIIGMSYSFQSWPLFGAPSPISPISPSKARMPKIDMPGRWVKKSPRRCEDVRPDWAHSATSPWGRWKEMFHGLAVVPEVWKKLQISSKRGESVAGYTVTVRM